MRSDSVQPPPLNLASLNSQEPSHLIAPTRASGHVAQHLSKSLRANPVARDHSDQNQVRKVNSLMRMMFWSGLLLKMNEKQVSLGLRDQLRVKALARSQDSRAARLSRGRVTRVRRRQRLLRSKLLKRYALRRAQGRLIGLRHLSRTLRLLTKTKLDVSELH